MNLKTMAQASQTLSAAKAKGLFEAVGEELMLRNYSAHGD